MILKLIKCVPLYDSRHVFPTLETSQKSGPQTLARCNLSSLICMREYWLVEMVCC